jgi:hypothetical protein
MQFTSKVYRDIPIEENAKNIERGLVKSLFLSMARSLENETKERLIPILSNVDQLRGSLEMNEMGYLKINTPTLENVHKVGKIKDVVDIVKKQKNNTKSIYFTIRKSAENLEITSKILIEVLPSNKYISVSIINYGMVQMPKNLRAETFIKDVKDILATRYIEKCEKVFVNFTDHMAQEFKNIFKIEPLVSDVKKVIIVPSGEDKKISKFYNRNFALQNITLAPAFYRDTDESPNYRYKGYSDPFNVLWWVFIFDYSISLESSTNFIDSSGSEVTQSEAAVLVNDVSRIVISNQLVDKNFYLEGNKHETFSESVEATMFSKSSIKSRNEEKKKPSSDSRDDTIVTGDGGSGHNSGAHSNSGGGHGNCGNASSCGGGGGGHCGGASSCGGTSSCGGASSCGGGGCGGGGCGGG